jgi:hypothetical protein
MQATNERGEAYEVNSLPMPELRGHMWKQYGNKIECQSCPTPHAAFLQPGFYISGYKDGIPVISQIATLPLKPLREGESVSTPDQQLDTKSRPTLSDA